jgi:hypothetical protein
MLWKLGFLCGDMCGYGYGSDVVRQEQLESAQMIGSSLVGASGFIPSSPFDRYHGQEGSDGRVTAAAMAAASWRHAVPLCLVCIWFAR